MTPEDMTRIQHTRHHTTTWAHPPRKAEKKWPIQVVFLYVVGGAVAMLLVLLWLAGVL